SLRDRSPRLKRRLRRLRRSTAPSGCPQAGGTGTLEATMFRFIRIKLNERAVVFQNGLPKMALGAGRHLLFGRNYTEQRFDTEDLVFSALPEVRAILLKDWFAEVKISAKQRGVLFRDGRPRKFLRPGTHRYWTVDETVELRVFSVNEQMP